MYELNTGILNSDWHLCSPQANAKIREVSKAYLYESLPVWRSLQAETCGGFIGVNMGLPFFFLSNALLDLDLPFFQTRSTLSLAAHHLTEQTMSFQEKMWLQASGVPPFSAGDLLSSHFFSLLPGIWIFRFLKIQIDGKTTEMISSVITRGGGGRQRKNVLRGGYTGPCSSS